MPNNTVCENTGLTYQDIIIASNQLAYPKYSFVLQAASKVTSKTALLFQLTRVVNDDGIDKAYRDAAKKVLKDFQDGRVLQDHFNESIKA